ncbi:MAG TPA: hypothetical protein PLQ44_00655 [Candidatus Paceibacterota bacterium]|nr:hypothetical protein [Candidatus Paceibacterota bacterium]
MENQANFNNSSGNLNNQPKKRRVAWIIIASIIILVALFLLFGGYDGIKGVYNNWQDRKNAALMIKGYNEMMDKISKTLTEDTYGGKTPQETLDMFINALEKGDIELAGKYFALDDNLSRQKWEDALKDSYMKGEVPKIIGLLKRLEASSEQSILETEYEFIVLGENGLADYIVHMRLNEYSKVWKIVSM